jgi:guanylate kinase
MKKKSLKSEPPFDLPSKQLLIVLSGPSGAGKDAVLSRLKESGHPIKFITTVTTRPKRAEEENNVAYHFVSTEDFQQMIKNKELLEWANVYGNWYGVPKEPVKQSLEAGHDTLIKIDIQGAASIKKMLPQAVFIFIMPPSMEELTARLKERSTESHFDLELRLKTAESEIKQLPLFDYVILNKKDDIERAVSAIEAIITAEKHRVTPREVSL